MKTILQLTWVTLLLAARIPITLFFNIALPLGFFIFYAGMLRNAPQQQLTELLVRLMTLGILSNAMFGLSMAVVVMREREMLRSFHLAPISALQFVTSRLIASYLLFVFVIVLELAASIFVFNLPIVNILVPLLVVFSLGYIAVAGIAFIAASLANTVNDAQVLNQLLFLGMLLLSGIAVPLSSMPSFFQFLSAFVPSSLIIVAGNILVHSGNSLRSCLPEIGCMAITAAVTLTLATAVFRWEKDSKMTGADRRRAAFVLVPLLASGIWLNVFQDFSHRLITTAEPPKATIQAPAASQHSLTAPAAH